MSGRFSNVHCKTPCNCALLLMKLLVPLLQKVILNALKTEKIVEKWGLLHWREACTAQRSSVTSMNQPPD